MRALDTAIQYVTPPMLVLAQTVPLPEGGGIYMEAVRTLGVLAVLAWYLWYTTSFSQPRLLESAAKQLDGAIQAAAKEREASNAAHRAEREALVQTQRAESDQKRKDFLDAIAIQRSEFQTILKTSTDAFQNVVEKINCKYQHHELPCHQKPSSQPNNS